MLKCLLNSLLALHMLALLLAVDYWLMHAYLPRLARVWDVVPAGLETITTFFAVPLFIVERVCDLYVGWLLGHFQLAFEVAAFANAAAACKGALNTTDCMLGLRLR